MKTFLILLLMAINACHCQFRCNSKDDIAKILEVPPREQDLEYLVAVTEKQNDKLNQTVSQYKPDEYPKDSIPIQCIVANIANLLGDIDLHVDEKLECSEETAQKYDSLEKAMAERTSNRVKRGFFGFLKKIVKGVVKIAQTIAKVVQVVRKVVSFVVTVISIIKDIKGIFGFKG